MKEFIEYQKNRGLDKQEFDYENACGNIVEELLEIGGLDVPKENRKELKKSFMKFYMQVQKDGIAIPHPEFDGIFSQADGFSDIKNFCDGEQLKLGFDPDKCDKECALEVHSRVGKIVDKKFEKDLSELAKGMWYYADYKKCLLPKEEEITVIHDDGYNTNATSNMLNQEAHFSGMLDDITFQENKMNTHDESRK